LLAFSPANAEPVPAKQQARITKATCGLVILTPRNTTAIIVNILRSSSYIFRGALSSSPPHLLKLLFQFSGVGGIILENRKT
jgi:hypothetical protein